MSKPSETASSVFRLVMKNNDPAAKGRGSYQLQIRFVAEFIENRHPIADCYRIDEQVILINQSVFDKG